MTTSELIQRLRTIDPDGNLPVGVDLGLQVVPVADVTRFDIPAIVIQGDEEAGF